jgi:hypothetical protein
VRGGRAAKVKGSRFERECVNDAASKGLQARRAWGSNGESLMCHEEVDVLIEGWKVQCKRRAELPAWLGLSEEVDVVFLKADNREALALVRLEDWLNLIASKGGTDGRDPG